MNYTNSTYDDLVDYLDYSAMGEPSDLMITVIFSCYIIYALAILLGIPCNLFVLYRMRQLSKKCSDLYSNGVGICLFLMAVSDISSLCSIFIHYVISITTETTAMGNFLPTSALNIICKVVTFSVHISTFVSIWSWLLMSTLRYLSVYHPLFYLRLWRLPFKAMFTVVVASIIFNLWLLFAVVNDPKGGCTMVSLGGYPLVNKSFLFLESTGSFIVPSLIILYVDMSVVLGFHYKRNHLAQLQMDDLRKNVPLKVNTKHHTFVLRWLGIALVDVVLNTPENLCRLGLILGVIEASESELYVISRILAQVPYYLQFGFNACYLALFIYDKSTRPAKARVKEGASFYENSNNRPSNKDQGDNLMVKSAHSDSGIDDGQT